MKTPLFSTFGLILAAATFLAATAAHAPAQVLLTHVHGLASSAAGTRLYIPSHHGLAVYEGGRWLKPGPENDYMGLSATRERFYSSGHPAPSSRLVDPFGLMRSDDGGKTWTKLGLERESDFHVLAAGFGSNVVYVWRSFLAGTQVAGIALAAGGVLAQGMMGKGEHMMGGRHMQEMMQRMMGDMLPPPMDPALLPAPDSEGARLLQQYCAQCHNLPGPGLHTAAEWPAVVERMNRRMRMMSRHGMMMGRVEAPSRQENVVILGYLQAHAQQPLTARLSPALESKAGQAFHATCAQCHVLPDPGQHSSGEWPAVVERMKGYMSAMGKVVPDESELRAITGFLQRHSGTKGIEPREQERH